MVYVFVLVCNLNIDLKYDFFFIKKKKEKCRFLGILPIASPHDKPTNSLGFARATGEDQQRLVDWQAIDEVCEVAGLYIGPMVQ